MATKSKKLKVVKRKTSARNKAVKKKSTSSTTVVHKKTTVKTKTAHKKQQDKLPNFAVQVKEPTLVRRDLLEALREVIVFMQGYENFKKLQEEKQEVLNELSEDVKRLNYLINTKLRRALPKGKIKGLVPGEEHEDYYHDEDVSVENLAEEPTGPEDYEEESHTHEPESELDELESQLQDIENQLQNIR